MKKKKFIVGCEDLEDGMIIKASIIRIAEIIARRLWIPSGQGHFLAFAGVC